MANFLLSLGISRRTWADVIFRFLIRKHERWWIFVLTGSISTQQEGFWFTISDPVQRERFKRSGKTCATCREFGEKVQWQGIIETVSNDSIQFIQFSIQFYLTCATCREFGEKVQWQGIIETVSNDSIQFIQFSIQFYLTCATCREFGEKVQWQGIIETVSNDSIQFIQFSIQFYLMYRKWVKKYRRVCNL